MECRLKKGFTLIEVMISLALFTAISISMMNVINQTTSSHRQIENLIKKNRVLQNISSAIRQDLQSMATTYNIQTSIAKEYINYLEETNQSSFFSSYLPSIDQKYFLSNQFPNTYFRGESDSLFFVRRTASPSGSLEQVAYLVEDCDASPVNHLLNANKNLSKKSKCLIRKSTYNTQDDLSQFEDEETKTTPLLTHILDVEFSYSDINQENLEWKDTFYHSMLKGYYYPLPVPSFIKLKIDFESEAKPIQITIPIDSNIFSHHIYSVSSLNLNTLFNEFTTPQPNTPDNNTPSKPKSTYEKN